MTYHRRAQCITELETALAAERALADELADNVRAAQAYIMLVPDDRPTSPLPGLLHFFAAGLARHRAARLTPSEGQSDQARPQ